MTRAQLLLLLLLLLLPPSSCGASLGDEDGEEEVDAPALCAEPLPQLPRTDGAALLRSRLAVVCWLESVDDVVVDEAGLGRVALEGSVARRALPAGRPHFGFSAGRVAELAEHAFAIENDERTQFCAAAIINDGELVPLDLSAYFESFSASDGGFRVELSGAGSSALESSSSIVSAGVQPERLSLAVGAVLFSETTECGRVDLRAIVVDGLSFSPAVAAPLPSHGRLMIVTAKFPGPTPCTDIPTIVDVIVTDRPCAAAQL